jgi:hypothetical protein
MRGRRRKGKEERDEGVFRTRLTRERSLGRRYEGVKEVRLERGRQRGKRRRVNSIIVGFINLGAGPLSIRRYLEDEPNTAVLRTTRTQITVHQEYLLYPYSP